MGTMPTLQQNFAQVSMNRPAGGDGQAKGTDVATLDGDHASQMYAADPVYATFWKAADTAWNAPIVVGQLSSDIGKLNIGANAIMLPPKPRSPSL